MFRILKVTGQSLAPVYRDGDFVLISKTPILFNRLKPGDVVVFRHPEHGILIKLVDQLEPEGGKVSVTGLNGASIDSRHFGPVLKSSLIGKVIWHIKRVG